MTLSPATPPAPTAAAIADSGLGRVIRVLWKPGETFAAIAARPTWATALLVILVASTIATLFWVPKIDVAEMIRDRIASSGQSIPADRMEIAVLSLWGLWILVRMGMASLASLAT